MTGRLLDTHLGSYDCKLITIEGSYCSTTENKIFLKWVFFFFYFRFRNVQNCSKIINPLSFYLLRYLSKWLHRQKVHPQVASWILIPNKVVIFKINTHNAGHIEPEKKIYGHHYSSKVIIKDF